MSTIHQAHRSFCGNLQRQIIANRVKRGWPSASDISKTICGLAEELGEFSRAVRDNDRAKMVDALGDVIVWAMGGIEILGDNSIEVVSDIILANSNRKTDSHH